MNKKGKITTQLKYLDLLDINSKKYRNAIKLWKKTDFQHFNVMCQICYKLINDYNMDFYTEVVFKNRSRADIFAFNGDIAVIIEVLHSESKNRFNKKKDYYPEGVTIIPVKTKDFDINSFKL